MTWTGTYITYSCGDEFGDALFVPQCPKCGRFVKPDKELDFQYNMLGDYKIGDNATCTKCGRVQMPFEGFM